MMKLSEMHASTHGVVKRLGRDDRSLNRVTSIGLTEGAEFQVIKNDKRMPVLLYVRETLLALNRKDCEKIEVEARA
jgi:ferrous iron transport protein A